MSTIIEELIVRLGLDSKDVDSKTPAATKKLDELDKSAQGVEKSSKAASVGMAEFTGKVGAFLALLGGTVAIKAFVGDVIETNTQLHYLAANLGMTVGALSSWGTVAAEFGGSAKDLAGTLSHLSMEATNFALRGQSSLTPFLSTMGVKPDQEHPENELAGIAEWVPKAQAAGLSRPAIHNILQQMGIDEGSINAMWDGTAALKALLDQAQKLAATPSEAEHAREATTQLALLHLQFKKIGMDLLEKTDPALEKLLTLLQDFGAWVQEHEEITAVFAAIALAIGGVAAAAGTLALALGALGAFAGVFGVLGLGLEALAGPIGLIAAAVAALGVGAGIGAGAAWLSHRDGSKASGGAVSSANIPDLAQNIAEQEGFYKQGTIPQRANNPGDIEYGDFAIRHGATGSMTSKDPATGKTEQIAIFPDEQTGWQAMYDLLGSSSYLGMNQSEAINKWQGKATPKTSSLLMGQGLSVGKQMAMIQSPSVTTPSTTSKNITNHIAAVNVYTQATDAKKMAADLGRGTDWLTFASQANSAVI